VKLVPSDAQLMLAAAFWNNATRQSNQWIGGNWKQPLITKWRLRYYGPRGNRHLALARGGARHRPALRLQQRSRFDPYQSTDL